MDMIGVRGFPNGIFNPWVRWNTWPGLGKEFFRHRRRRRPPSHRRAEAAAAARAVAVAVTVTVKIHKFINFDYRLSNFDQP